MREITGEEACKKGEDKLQTDRTTSLDVKTLVTPAKFLALVTTIVSIKLHTTSYPRYPKQLG